MTPSLNPDSTIAFIGTGNMARAIIGGLINSGHPAKQIIATARNAEKLADLADQGVATGNDNHAAIKSADVVLLCVKPQMMLSLLAELRDTLVSHSPLVISVAAGIKLDTLQASLSPQLPIVRCMPNTPSLVGLGASGLFASESTLPGQRELAAAILQAVGVSVWVDSDDKMDAVTAVSGSGPAYYFMVMEAMI